MKKYNVNVIRTDEYIIEIDEKIWNKKYLKSWGGVFFKVDSVKDIAEHLASLLMRLGYEGFLEGFGYVYTQNRDGYKYTQFDKDKNGEYKEVTELTEGIKVTIIHKDDDYGYETEELIEE